MPAVKLVNVAVSAPLVKYDEGDTGAHTFLHQKLDDGTHGGKPIPRDPTCTQAFHDLGPSCTVFETPDHGCVFNGQRIVEKKLGPAEQARAIVHDWAMHSDAAIPAFVLPNDPASKADCALAAAVSERFQAKKPDEAKAIAVGQAFVLAGRSSDDAQAAHDYHLRATTLGAHLWLPGDEGKGLESEDLIQLLAATERERWEEMLAHIEGPTALLLNAGRDDVLKNAHTTGSQATPSNYISHSANTTTPAASDTTLTGEITTAGGGLIPAQATWAHTNGTATDTLTLTRTANGSDSLPVTLGQIGIRNASAAGGTLGTKTLLSSTATISAAGDAITTTVTTTLTPS